MLVLKVYRMLEQMDILDKYGQECAWEYNTASGAECSRFIPKEFFEQWDKYNAEWEELANQIYNNTKMRRIAELLNKDIAEMFRDWDNCDEEMGALPFT